MKLNRRSWSKEGANVDGICNGLAVEYSGRQAGLTRTVLFKNDLSVCSIDAELEVHLSPYDVHVIKSN